jgi:3-hydroxyisobutyrate dehydrogenase
MPRRSRGTAVTRGSGGGSVLTSPAAATPRIQGGFMSDTFAPPERIGFVGLGKMGTPMTRNLKRAGFQLALNDIDPALARSLGQELDAPVYERVSDLARECRVVITMVPDGRIVRQVAIGQEGKPGTGLVDGFARGSVLIDMSSSAPVGTRKLGEGLPRAAST